MFPSWRLKIREARLAASAGRWQEACALLSRDSVRDFLPAKRLSQEVALQLVERARLQVAAGESQAGWEDLHRAARLGGCNGQVERFRQDQASEGIERVRRLISAGETTLAERQIAKLEQRRLGGDQRRAWKHVVRLIAQAKDASRAGDFQKAADALSRAQRMLPEGDPLAGELESRILEMGHDGSKFGTLELELHQALAAKAWTQVMKCAAEMLELAPGCPTALVARQQAWDAVGIDRGPPHASPARNGAGNGVAVAERRPLRMKWKSTQAWAKSAEDETMTTPAERAARRVAWIDEVGSFLFCLGSEVVLGQPSLGGGVDVPIKADISRRHAVVRREGESYVLIPHAETSIDGERLTAPAVLRDGALIELGGSVKLRFRRPHSLSATAVLSFESFHKPEPAVDAVVLMSESCILGPRRHSHICCRNWSDDLVIFRRGSQLWYRTSAPVEVDDEPQGASGQIPANGRLAGDDFALSFEEI